MWDVLCSVHAAYIVDAIQIINITVQISWYVERQCSDW
jgi:hypothetical protein